MIKPFHQLILLSILTKLTFQIEFCNEIEQTSPAQVWQIIKISQFDKIFLLSAGALSLVIMLGSICSWIVYKSFSTPSDIMLAIIISQFIQNLSLVIQAGYFVSVDSLPQQPNDFNYNCFWMGTIQVLGYISSTYYNLTFCIIFSYSIRNTLKKAFFDPLKYHIISLVIILSLILTVTLTQSLGRSLNGVCGLRIASRQSTARFILEILIAIICFYSMIKFKSQLPKNEYFQKKSVFGYYYYYMGLFAVIQIIQSISYLISDIMCRTDSSDIYQTLHIFYSISNCTSILLSYAISLLRFSHPILLEKIIKLIKRKDKINQNEKQLPQLNFQQSAEKITDEQTNSWLGCLLESLKGSQILSFIQGITIAFVERQRKYINCQLNALSYQRHYTFQINEKIIDNYIEKRISSRESLIRKQNLGGLNSLHYEVTSYCPEAFSALTSRSQLRQIIQSLSIKKNINIVKKESYTNGGKSGEFFFGTYDHRHIFKTIKQDQALLYLENVKQFMEYFKKQQNSLIVPILGLFRFVRKDVSDDAVYIMLMKNLTLTSKQHVLRVYDIKGSQFNRSLMQEKKIQIKQEKLRKYTLKDKDFQKLQKKVMVNEHNSKSLKRMLRKDVQFLGKLGLMDYSLLIIKRKGNQIYHQKLSQMKSAQEQGVIYNFGIIDYLESWTLKRKAERAFKTLITNQQVTASSPMNYSSRLSQFIDSII